MTEGFFSEPADDEDPGAPGFGATDAAEYGQQTGLNERAALRRLRDLGCDPVAAANAVLQTRVAGDGIAWLDGIRVRWDEGYGYSVERAPQPERRAAVTVEIGRDPSGATDFTQYILDAIRIAGSGQDVVLTMHGKPVVRMTREAPAETGIPGRESEGITGLFWDNLGSGSGE